MECSNTVTPHVIALRLNGYIFYFRGNITSSLLDLHHLNELDLSGIDFGGIRIPKFIASIKSLQHLHLSYSNFSGDISFMFENLTNLITLDLSNNHLTASTFNWLLNTSSTLVTLDLSNNQFHGPIPDAFGRLSFLQSLHLSGNMFEGVIPKSFGNLTHLQDLSLSNNHLGVPLDEILGNLSASTQMKSLLLSTTNLTGPVSTTHLSQFSQLEKLDLSYNSLQGKIFEAHFVKLIKLKELDLSSNSLIVDLSPDWVPPFHIEVMHLSRCKIGPSFPPWLHTQKSLAGLDLSNNGISGEVPKWFWNLSTHMMDLNLSHNHMNGIIPDLSSLPLHVFDVCFNHFSGPLPLLKSSVVLMNQNNFSESNISSFICPFSYNYFTVLDLSNNKLAGEFPDCWEDLPFLEIINLNNNNLSGEIPHGLGSLSFLTTLHLRDNNLSGELPSSLKNCHALMLLDIGGNSFTGRIPLWLDGKNYNAMTYLSLRHNRFYGGIPQELCKLNRLQMLDLSRNNISGNIPQCFNNFTSLVDKNTTTASSSFVPFSNGSYIDIEHALVQWKGRELEYSKTLGMLKLIDLSSNRLVGNIPKALSSLKGLISLNLSRNSLTGNIDSNIGEMEMLESLDLSSNHLSGEIPIGLGKLHYLAVLDLENNNLSGKIPSSTQLQSFDASVYAENKDLCGLPLKLCPGDGLGTSINNEGEETDGGIFMLSFMQEFGISVPFGFIVGFWGVVGSLLLNKSWRHAYFNFLKMAGNWIYVTMFVDKFKRSQI